MKVLLLALIAIIPHLSWGQSNSVDSLLNAFQKTEIDTSRVNILIAISKEYEIGDSEGFEYARQSYELAQSTESKSQIAKSELTYGPFLSVTNLDSGISMIDSSRKMYESLDMSIKVLDAYWNTAITYEYHNKYDSATHYYNTVINGAEKMGNDLYIADGYSALGTLDNIRGNNSQALKYSTLARQYYEKTGEEIKLSQSYNQIGIIYDYMGMYDEALENYLKAREIAVEANDPDGEILIVNNIGVVYSNMGNNDEALMYYNEAIEKAAIYGQLVDKATLLNNLSYIYLEEGDVSQALTTLWESIQIAENVDYPCFDIYPMEGIGAIYTETGKFDSAQYYLDSAYKKALICEDVGILTSVQKDFGKLYLKQKKYNKALKAFKDSYEISKKASLTNDFQESIFELYKYYKEVGNTSEAIKWLENYQKVSDSLNEAKTIEKANQLVAEYEFKKQVEILKKEQDEATALFEKEIQTKQRENTIIIIALILVAIFSGILGRLYYRIQHQNKRLKWLNEEKNTLMGVVAHDLRNPLNMIKGLMQVIEQSKPSMSDKNWNQYLHLIKISTTKMSNMIDKVLDISAIENMKVNLQLTKANLGELASRSVDNFSQIAAQKDIKLELNLDTSANYYASIDTNYFDQIMDNLISNAIKFSEKGKMIKVNLDSDQEHHMVTVEDQGPGLSAVDQENLFKKFKPLASKPTSDEQSTGLGLSIVKKFMDAMGAEINLDSELGRGSSFMLKFKAT